jgi:hypothetical protein
MEYTPCMPVTSGEEEFPIMLFSRMHNILVQATRPCDVQKHMLQLSFQLVPGSHLCLHISDQRERQL